MEEREQGGVGVDRVEGSGELGRLLLGCNFPLSEVGASGQ